MDVSQPDIHASGLLFLLYSIVTAKQWKPALDRNGIYSPAGYTEITVTAWPETAVHELGHEYTK